MDSQIQLFIVFDGTRMLKLPETKQQSQKDEDWDLRRIPVIQLLGDKV